MQSMTDRSLHDHGRGFTSCISFYSQAVIKYQQCMSATSCVVLIIMVVVVDIIVTSDFDRKFG